MTAGDSDHEAFWASLEQSYAQTPSLDILGLGASRAAAADELSSWRGEAGVMARFELAIAAATALLEGANGPYAELVLPYLGPGANPSTAATFLLAQAHLCLAVSDRLTEQYEDAMELLGLSPARLLGFEREGLRPEEAVAKSLLATLRPQDPRQWVALLVPYLEDDVPTAVRRMSLGAVLGVLAIELAGVEARLQGLDTPESALQLWALDLHA